VTSSKPAIRYQDVRRNVAKIREYVARGGGLDRVLTEQSMAYDAIRMCFLEISEAAIKLGALAELHEPDFRGAPFVASETTCVIPTMKWT
jgi:hypothetical protein